MPPQEHESVTSKEDTPSVLGPSPSVLAAVQHTAVPLAAVLNSPRWYQKHSGHGVDKPSPRCFHRIHQQFVAHSLCTLGTSGLGSDLLQWGRSEGAMLPSHRAERWGVKRKGQSSHWHTPDNRQREQRVAHSTHHLRNTGTLRTVLCWELQQCEQPLTNTVSWTETRAFLTYGRLLAPSLTLLSLRRWLNWP